MINIDIINYNKKHLLDCTRIWNDCITDGNCFFWKEAFKKKTIKNIIKEQDYVGVAVSNKNVVGFYIIHKNNAGRGSHIANALYAVDKKYRGKGIGYLLGKDSLIKIEELKYKGIQFNSVVKNNISSVNLWKKLGFTIIGEIPNAYYIEENKYESIYIMYKNII